MSVPPNNVTAAPPPPAGTPSAEEKQWAMFAHLSALSACVTGIGAIVGPLVIWQIKKNEMPFVDDQGKEATNFNITMLIICVALWIFTIITFGIGILLLWALAIANLVFIIIAALAANNGQAYRYPFAFRFIR